MHPVKVVSHVCGIQVDYRMSNSILWMKLKDGSLKMDSLRIQIIPLFFVYGNEIYLDSKNNWESEIG